jgi:hypothetical protein
LATADIKYKESFIRIVIIVSCLAFCGKRLQLQLFDRSGKFRVSRLVFRGWQWTSRRIAGRNDSRSGCALRSEQLRQFGISYASL